MSSTLQSLKFLFVGPAVLLFLAILNLVTAPGDWWIQWPALGIGIAWVISLFRVLKAVAIGGGLAALAALIARRA